MAENEIANGVTNEQIAEWKAKYGDVFLINLGDEKFIYRPLKRFEYKTIMLNADSTRAFNEEKIVQMCVINPVMDVTKMPTLKAGTISTLVELIMAASNFGATEEPIKL
jgi:hypothetical protein